MNNRKQNSGSIDGFISRRQLANTDLSKDKGSSFKRREETHSKNSQTLQPKRSLQAEQPGLLSFDNEDPVKVDRPEPIKKGKWSRFAHKRGGKSGKRFTRKRIMKFAIILVLLLGVWFGFKAFMNFRKLFNGANIFSVFDTTRLKGEDVGRVNILVAGNSADDPGHDGANLTDSIMLVSIDTIHHNAVMMSIPRDLWVDYQTQDCSVGYQGKINAVYECGQQTKFKQAGYPKGGMGLLEKVVHDNLGVNINYYSLIDYAALKDSVNAVGGIKINLQTGDPRGIYDPTFDWQCNNTCTKVKYPNGEINLNGQQSLNLARARGDFGGYGSGNDFGRAQRQREMMVALKDKALSAGTVSNPVKLTKLMDSIGKHVHTDFKPNEVHRLYDIGKGIDSKKIKSVGLTTQNYLTDYNAAGQSALAPKAGITDFSDIQAYLKRVLSSDPAAQEDSHVVVLNGSNRAGLASDQAKQLSNTFTVDDIGNANGNFTKTAIYDLSGKKPDSKKRLASTYHVTIKNKKDTPAAYKTYDTDFVIIIGNDVVSR